MTTIVVSKAEMAMAADRQCTLESGYKSKYQPKIKRLVHNHTGPILFGTAGKVEHCVTLEKWFMEALDKPGMKHDMNQVKDAQAILLYANGGIVVYEGSLTPFEIQDKVFGIGSGAQFAIGAMLHGAKLKEAIRIASVCDAYTGMGIQYESFRK